MEPLSEKNIRAQLLDFLANLQNTATVRERQTLVDYTGFQRLTSQISWEGDTFTFFGGLVNLLAHDRREALLEFLAHLVPSEYVPLERKQTLTTLSEFLASCTPQQWHMTFRSTSHQIDWDTRLTLASDLRRESFKLGDTTAAEFPYVTTPIQEAYDDALQALRNASDEKASAKSGILVLGEANAGKTRLALEALMSVLPTWPSSIGS